MWFEEMDDDTCKKYLKNGSRRKIELVVNYLLYERYYGDDFFLSILKNYGHLFNKNQRSQLSSVLL